MSTARPKSKDRSKRNPTQDICTPIAVYQVARKGLRYSNGTSGSEKLDDLLNVGTKLALPQKPNEPASEYATRLRHALKPYDREEYIDGTAVYMLRLILDLHAAPASSK